MKDCRTEERTVQLSGMAITFKVDLTRTAKLSAERRLECLAMPNSDSQLTLSAAILYFL